MVVGHPDRPRKRTQVAAQMASALAHYGRLVVVARNGDGPGHLALGWAAAMRVPSAATTVVGPAAVAANVRAAGEAMVALRPDACVSFGPCPEADAARAAGVPTYEV